MADTELEQSIIHHAKEVIAESESEAIKQYGTAVIMSVEIAKKSHLDGKYLHIFLDEAHTINTKQDTLLLVCLGIIYTSAINRNASDLLTSGLSEETLGFTMTQYSVVKELVESERPESFLEYAKSKTEENKTNEDDKLMEEFEWLVSVTIGRLYKKSPLWKRKLMWQLVKEWNSRQFKVGIGADIRKRIGEDEALVLFRETANNIMNNPELLNKAVNDYHESNPYAK